MSVESQQTSPPADGSTAPVATPVTTVSVASVDQLVADGQTVKGLSSALDAARAVTQAADAALSAATAQSVSAHAAEDAAHVAMDTAIDALVKDAIALK